MQIRQLQVNEYDKALTLSLDVFIQCGKNDFDEEGLKTFKSFIYNKDLVNAVSTAILRLSRKLSQLT